MVALAQNEMKAKGATPLRVRLTDGLGVTACLYAVCNGALVFARLLEERSEEGAFIAQEAARVFCKLERYLALRVFK